MGQQISAAVEGNGSAASAASSSPHASAPEGKPRLENGDAGRPSITGAWRNTCNFPAISSAVPVRNEGAQGPVDASKMAPKSDAEVSRMSIRAAIDTFIENCLSANNDVSSDERGSNDSSPSLGNHGAIDGPSGSRDHVVKEESYSEFSKDGEESQTASISGDDFSKGVKKTEVIDDDDDDDDEKDSDDKTLVIDCDDKSSAIKKEIKTESSSDSTINSLKDNVKKEDSSCDSKGVKLEQGKDNGKLPSGSTGSSGTSSSATGSDKPPKPSPPTEKQSFSDYLQDRLKRGGYDKHEELTQLALNKDIQSHGQMLMWEMTKKPVANPESANPASGQSSSSFTSGPVRLQTLIDKVLDNSLNNQDLRPFAGLKKQKEGGASIAQGQDSTSGSGSPKNTQSSDASPAGDSTKPKDTEATPASGDKTEAEPKPKKSTLCFKDHIDKVLLESFLSYEEEEEKREAMKGKDSKPAEERRPVETDSERMMNAKKEAAARSGSDGTISVQDIVDRVISQTEVISKLLTPAASEASKTSPSGQSEGSSSQSSAAASTPAHAAMKYKDMTVQGKALLDAQRHTVQKEHQTSATMGRKRGRPRLGSPSAQSNWASDPAKEMKSSYHDHRMRDLKHGQHPHGSHPSDPSRESGAPHYGHARPGQGPPPLDYAPRGSIPYGLPVDLTSLMTSQGTAPPSSSIYQQRHHMMQQRQQQPPPGEPNSSGKPSLPMSTTSTSNYHPGSQDSILHRGAHHPSQPSQPHPHRSQPHPGHQSGSKPPPPLILADHIKESMSNSNSGSRLVPVSHIPTKSCSCHSCIAHFSREKSPSYASHLPHHMRHPASKPDRGVSEPGPTPHSSHYHPYQTSTRRSSKDYYPQSISASTEALRPVVAVPGQGLPPQAIIPSYVAAQRQRQEPAQPTAPSSRESSSSRYYDTKGANPGQYPPPPHHPHPSQTGHAKPGNPDPRYAEPQHHDRHPSRHGAMPEHSVYEHDLSKRTVKPPHIIVAEPPSVEVPAMAPSASQDADQPLDLSVKPSPAHRKDTRSSIERSPDVGRHDPSFADGRHQYNNRRPSFEHSSRGHSSQGGQGQGQYVEYERSGPGGHHLQRLENSVDRFFPQGQSHAQHPAALGMSHPHQQQQQQLQQQQHHHQQQQQQQQQRHKMSPLPPAHQSRVAQPGLSAPHHHPSATQDRHHPASHHGEQMSHRGQPSNFHPRTHSPMSYPHPKTNPSPSQQQHPPPSAPAHHSRNIVPSPGHQPYHDRRSPGVGLSHQYPPRNSGSSPHPQQSYPSSGNQARPLSSASPAGYQRPPSHNQEHDLRLAPATGPLPTQASHPPSSTLLPPHPTPPSHPHHAPPSHPHAASAPPPHPHSAPLLHPHNVTVPPQHPPSAPPAPSPHSASHTPVSQLSQGTPTLPPHPENTPSPDDPEAQRLNVSKHEPIQNIIGSHPPSDILYLICRLCRQTYGSPYGFRKHFRNQHGFEPKAEHTIVQTISATKTAMAHTGPMDIADKPLLSQSPKDEKAFQDEAYLQSQGLKTQPGETSTPPFTNTPTNPSQNAEETKLSLKKDLPENTKFLECPECGQTFQLNDFGSYKRHCRQHSLHRTSGPFACNDCQKSFAEPGQLQEHLDTHSSFTASVCGICRTPFSCPNYLAGHLQAAHGHVYNSEGGEKGAGSSDSSDGQRRLSQDSAEKSEGASTLLSVDQGKDSEIKRSSSFSGALPAASSSSGNTQPSLDQQSGIARSSSMSVSKDHMLPISKRHRLNLSSAAADSQMFTVHTPKGLEVQKLPADAVVTTASPDSSYDEAKFHLDSQPGSSVSQKTPQTVEAASSGASESTKDSNSINTENKSSNMIVNLPKQSDLSSQGKSAGSKDDTESNSSDRCPSVESNSMSHESSRAASPGFEEADKFYKHKKYSRHRKRVSSSEAGGEPEAKSQRVDSNNSNNGNQPSSQQDQSPYSVSSTANSGITFRDCESSCLHSEDSNTSCSSKSKGEDGKHGDEKSSSKQGSLNKDDKADRHLDTKNRKSDSTAEDSKSGSKKDGAGDTGTKFKWDRQTRSQAGKAVQSVSYTSS